MLSTIFVVLVGLTVALIVFTPLKYYIPGSGTNYKSVSELKQLKYRVDELEKKNSQNALYIDGLKKALSGDAVKLDTTRLNLPPAEISND